MTNELTLWSWNVNGYRSALSKGIRELIKNNGPDILCLQETKVAPEQLEETDRSFPEFEVWYSSAQKKGYSGVATFVREKPELLPSQVQHGIGEAIFDNEGRFVISTHKDFTLYNLYLPSGTSGDERQAFKYKFLDSFYAHLAGLPQKTRDALIICGDFNICHREIDIHHPAQATRLQLTGFLPEERAWVDRFLELGFVDTFRHVHGDVKDRYSWWSFRANSRQKNLGWRLDYFFVSQKLASRVTRADILMDTTGSDHCPVVLGIR